MIRFLLLPLLLSCVLVLTAADSIGSVFADGRYRVHGAGVRGSATLFDGDTVEIGDAPAKVQLNVGARTWLSPGAKATAYSRGMVLLQGLGQLEGPAGSRIDAGALRVVASAAGTVVRVSLSDGEGMVVEPLRGAVDVMNAHGTRVGIVDAGSAVRFAERARGAADVQVSGCLYMDKQQFGITDRITHVPVRLRGQALNKDLGHLVSISGLEGPGGVVNVTGIQRLAGGACTAPRPALLASAALSERPPDPAPQTTPMALNLVVVEGEGAINNIRQRTAREPIVQVEDENRRPVAGAAVLFALPRSGPGATFPNGANTLRVITDQQGRAIARGLRPNNQAGDFTITVTASYGALRAAVLIRQRNAIAGATGGSPGTTAATGAAEAGAEAGARTAAGGRGAGTTAGGARGAGGASGAGGATQPGATRTSRRVGAPAIAIIGGVAASAVVGGLAAGGVIFGGGGPEPAASR